ncbi:MerR family transcriptional regulator [Mycolicibacterium wolinskyi]|uniref:MerR family transcriptional regulator n=1 Tax=Mycolicibacterium TaxID=1866885 RepID=UPI001A98C95B|nr:MULTISPECIES: MerR family transcriptional regulator [Mycolicibacterium]MCV7290774.1 MerR family transcriptional regulator [Mycolicibacterium wolinskyi]MCV7291173.1 MerR family transcriptional regulator [Mycolicibacterium goodii]
MRISELAEQSGVTVATIKYYVREGLLPPGNKMGERRAEYGDRHVARLRLLRVLREVGDIPVSDLKQVVDAIDNESLSTHEMNGAAYDALVRTPGAVNAEMRALATQVVQEAGWTRVRPESPAIDHLAGLLGVVLDLSAMFDMNHAATYLGLIDALAAYEVGRLNTAERIEDRDAVVQQMVIGQVVFGQLLLSLRRIAHEHHSALRFFDEPPAGTHPD